MTTPLLAVESVRYRHDAQVPEAVAGVSLRVDPGEVVGLIGPNAAGKSTLARIACGLLRPAAGSVRLRGDDAFALPRRERARRVAFLSQDEPADLPFTARCAVGQRLVIPVKHGDGRWFAPPDLVAELEANGQVVLRYAEPCNGSVDDIAGVCNERGNVMGLMPHPEHAVDRLLGSADGALILASLVEAARDRAVSLA